MTASLLPSRFALVLGADESLRSLLGDVLGDMGFALRGAGEGSGPTDVVLALVRREEDVLRGLQAAGEGARVAPLLGLLPFADERLESLALCRGVLGCYALGTPLEGLRRLLRQVSDGAGVSRPSEANGRNQSGRHDG